MGVSASQVDEAPSPETTILIVEDDPLIRALLADHLRTSGYVVIEVATADEAMTAMSSGWEMHLVFSDVGLPGTMGGFTFAMWMQDHHPAIPMVLSSGVPHVIPILSNQDAVPFLAKPYRVEDASRLIAEVLTKSHTD